MKKFTFDEAFKASLAYFNGDELAANTWIDKYALRDLDNNILEKIPEDMHWRMANEFARIEKNKFKQPLSAQQIFNYFDKFKYIVPQGSPMSGIGNKFHFQTLGNCYVVDNVADSYGGIFYTDQVIGQLMKRRAGAGVDISNIRPRGVGINNSAKTTDGIGVFMERYSNTCREVAQGGRRGALLLSISVHHPEVETFINIKRDKKKVTGANVSVKLTDEFLKAVENDKEYEQYWPLDGSKKQITRTVKARQIWNQIIQSNWEAGEPGVMFWDTMIRNSLSNSYGKIDSRFYDKTTNPCGEIIMGADSCRLMVLNLFGFVKNPFTDKAAIDAHEFRQAVEVAQRLMDDLIDLELECIDRIIEKVGKDKEAEHIKQIEIDTWKSIKDVCIKGRRTGLGITGLADTIAALGLKFGSDESVKAVDQIFENLATSSMKSSCLMAKELGAFPIYSKKIEEENITPLMKRIFKACPEVEELHNKYGRRNISLTTCSPTGTVSILTQTSSGIEPVFELSYKRRKKINADHHGKNIKVDFVDEMGDKWQEFEVYHHNLQLWKDVTKNDDITKSPYYKSTAGDIDTERHVEIQGAVQKWISHSVSKTVNASNSTPKEAVAKLYLKAWKTGCKGITFYRDGSRSGVLVKDTTTETPKNVTKRPKELPCDIYHITITKKLDKVRHFEYMVLVGMVNNEPYEVFCVENGKTDKKYTKGIIVKHAKGKYELVLDKEHTIKNLLEDTTDSEDSLTRMVSTCLRHKIPIHYIIEQLSKTEGELFSFSKSIARSLKKYIKEGTVSTELCSQCGSKLVFESGCFCCKNCGNSKCS